MRHALAALTLLLLAACGFVHDEHIDGPYRLVAVDSLSDMVVCYDLGGGNCIGRTPSMTTGYGFSERWITAVVRRGAQTEYYFIDRNADHRYLNGTEITQGSFSESQFLARAQELGLPPVSHRLDE
jgi:hypothetical protein